MKYNSKSKVEREGGYRIRLKLQKGLVKAGWWLYKLKFHQDSVDKLHMLGTHTHTHKKKTGIPTNDHPSRKMLALNWLFHRAGRWEEAVQL